MSNSVLLAFSDISFAFSQLQRLRKSRFKCFCNCLSDLFLINKLVSSAKRRVLQYLIQYECRLYILKIIEVKVQTLVCAQ